MSCFPYSIDSQLLGSAFGQSRIFDFIYKFGQGASIRDVSNNIKITVKFTEKKHTEGVREEVGYRVGLKRFRKISEQ